MPDTPPQFTPGWHFDLAQAAHKAFLAEGRVFAPMAFEDDRPLPKGFSLSRFRFWPFNQGPVGTCWENSATQVFQIHTAADGTYEPVALSRCMVGWRGKQLDGGGNPADGGSVLNGMLAMSDPPKGAGVCHEEKWPYKPDRRYFAQGPPPGATDDAALNRIHQIAQVAPEAEPIKRSLFNGHPMSIGISWPGNWDSCDNAGRVPGPGWPVGGHAVAIIGWLDDWDGQDYFEVENSHGAIYHPLPADVASRVIGYKPAFPDKTHDFWVRRDWLLHKLQGDSEVYSAAGLTGFKKRVLDWADMM